ncbi:rhodanese-like/PpiC domain-containing protein 12, chloroplastic [Tripterygium wilfordii]|uniref:rhodanese-like/PpiC domain-containing protein 12, chloroplastic n=1 Tax=Tripterygium wilfordii TaxID=458696 RepID=UPI0018F7FD8B|nr:rhodanese-like/PpiC domain-containing protein 12, chloroplastic [Tripterygium wilfordii]
MLRASPAAFTTLRQSLLPTLSLSSSSSFLHKFSTFASFSSFPPNSLEPNSLRLSSLCFRRPPFLMDPPCPRGTARASFSAEGCSKGEREVLVQHLLVKEDGLNLLLDIQQRVEKGEDLSDLAAEYSICPSKEEGGMLGWVGKGQMVPEFEEAAFDAPLNKVVKCKTKFGWHLLQVLSEREESMLQDIPPAELHVKTQDPNFVEEAQLIDVREPEEVAQASLPGFQVLPLSQCGGWGPVIMTKFDPLKDTYVMCHHGLRSLQVAKWLQTQGFRKVFNVAGGIHAYATKVDQSIPTY